MIDLPNISAQIEMNERKKYLEMHNHKKWISYDGKWCTYLPDETKTNKRVLCKRSTEEKLNDEIVKYWRQFDENPTIREVFDEWRDRKLARNQIKRSSHTLYGTTFNRFYSKFGLRRIKNVSEQDWEDFLCNCIVEYKLSAKSFSDLKSITKGFLKRAKKRKLITMDVEHFFLELDVSDNDFKVNVINEEDEVFFDDEVEKIMGYIREHPDLRNLGIALMFVTGIRVGELVALRTEDFQDTAFQVKRTQSKYRNESGKGFIYEISDFPKTPAGYRTVIVPTEQKWICDKLLESATDYIFCENGKVITTDNVRKRLYTVCKKVGIPERSPHKIRKTYGSILLDNGLDRKIIEGQMGHTNISCTEKYYHRNRKKLQQKQEIFDKIPELVAI